MWPIVNDRSERAPQGAEPYVPVASDEWNLLLSSRANVLVVGPEGTINNLLSAWLPYMEAPLYWWRGDMALPPPDVRTVILGDIAALTGDQQIVVQRMVSDATASIRFISVSTRPVYELVKDDRFPENLYYRLNMLYLAL